MSWITRLAERLVLADGEEFEDYELTEREAEILLARIGLFPILLAWLASLPIRAAEAVYTRCFK